MMHNMTIPEKVDHMLKPVHPVTSKVQRKKSNDIHDDRIGNICKCQVPDKKWIGEYNKIKPDNIFGYIGNATTAKTADHI